MYYVAEERSRVSNPTNKEGGEMKIENFEQLTVWQQSIDLSVYIYKITDDFPKAEQFDLTNQLRRASSSISANIAEGFGRRTKNDKLHFYTIAYGSLLEVKSFTYLANKLGFIENIDSFIDTITNAQRLLNAFITSTKKL